MTANATTAIVLAADRGREDPVATATGAPCKALSPVAGTPLIWRVIGALRQVEAIERILLVGPAPEIMQAQPQLVADLQAAGVLWIAPAQSPAASAALALATLAPDQPALITTADHALLQPAMVKTMLGQASNHDLAAGLASYGDVRRAYPDARRTVIRLAPEDGYCGCNLFVVNTARGRALVERWQRLEAQRKHPARWLASLLGWRSLLEYALGRLTLETALARLRQRTDVNAGAVLLDAPRAALDVDSVDDLKLVASILAGSDDAYAEYDKGQRKRNPCR